MGNILYLDLSMGAAGDMLTAALSDLLPDGKSFFEKINSLGLPGIKSSPMRVLKCGIAATHVHVTVNGHTEGGEHKHGHDHEHAHEHHRHHHEHEHHHEHDHSHRHVSLGDIKELIASLDLPEKVRTDAANVYGIIAEAESKVHGRQVNEVHFHEVGALDAVCDVVSVCLALDILKPDRIIASPVCTGSGTVETAHGVLSIPAPATAEILKGIPVYQGNIKKELCTPTGAALIRYFVSDFCSMPLMTVDKTGNGAGRRDLDRANVLRAFYGHGGNAVSEVVTELSFNVDDMTGEEIGYCTEALFKAGAREVYTTPVGMKKSRPGTLVTLLCDSADKTRFVELIFSLSTTIGVRENTFNRYILERRTEEIDTPLGRVRRKISEGFGIRKEKIEYDDAAEIAGTDPDQAK
ncbi:MAG: nickel pincer cofactor biosynthesis protein LarC [Clostridia bacterium]|nr:nickel pincer cofactor biosynthesis protein LarC [Clostridia bacterium]